ncbi:MAG TPA: hypothetical protein VFC48_07685, partial [Cellulomonas sp.]|nr:hypothetical protein [Cellulomonas sp.]
MHDARRARHPLDREVDGRDGRAALGADDAGSPADDDTLVAAVRKAGYDARVLSRRSLTTAGT